MAKKRRFESFKAYFSRRQRERSQRESRLQLQVEALEDRVLLSANVLIDTGVTTNIDRTEVASVVTYSPNADDAVLNAGEIVTDLNAGKSVVVDTITSGTVQPGDISVATVISAAGVVGANLELSADSRITVNDAITSDGSFAAYAVDIDLNASLALSGDSSVTLSSERSILMSAGSSINTIDGGITLSANEAGTTTGDFVGIELKRADISSTNGDILLTGHGGDTGFRKYGVELWDGATISSQGVGSFAGTISISGTGGSGAGSDNKYGVRLWNVGTKITAVDGDIRVTGRAGSGTSSGNSGVAIESGPVIESTGTGPEAATITLDGTAGSGLAFDSGLYVYGAGTLISSVAGDIHLTGGGGGGNNSPGVWLRRGGAVQSTGNGGNAANITIRGDGGSSNNLGVVVTDADSQVGSVDGIINIDGTGGGTSGSGVLIDSGGIVHATGTGWMSILGDAAGTGVGVTVNSSISAQSGYINLVSSDRLEVGATGHISTSGGAITFQSDDVTIDPVTAIIDSGFGIVTLRGSTTVREIDLGTETSGKLSLTDSELDRITAGVLRIGGNNAGAVTISSGISPAGTDTLHLISGGQVRETATGLTVANLAIEAGDYIVLNKNNNVRNLAVHTPSATANFRNNGNLSIGEVDGVSGIVVGDGQTRLNVFGGDLTIEDTSAANDVDSQGVVAFYLSSTNSLLSINSGAHVETRRPGPNYITADHMNWSGTMDSGPGWVELFPATSNRGIDLGSLTDTSTNSLELSDVELDRITASRLVFDVRGLAGIGPIIVSAAITRQTATNLNLLSNSFIHFTTGSLNSAGGNITLDPGTYISPASIGTDVSTGAGTLLFGSGDDLNIVIDGTTVDTEYEQLNVAGRVNLSGLNLALNGTHTPESGNTFIIVENDGADAIVGIFNGLPEGEIVTLNGVDLTITYVGGTGNDVVLLPANQAPSILDQSFSINENSANTTVVGTASATDPDLPTDTLAWTITDGNTGGAFAIDSDTGQISVVESTVLDFETTPVFNLTVEVEDRGGLTDSATITINLNDVTAMISGTVFVDADGDGLFDGGTETGIDGVTIELLDSTGGLLFTDETELGGAYAFIVADEVGTYRIREIQPTGVGDGAAILGDAGGSILSSNEMQLTLPGGDASDYDFTEVGQAVQSGDTATIGFWQNKNGQALIHQGGAALVSWLNANFGNIFGDAFSDGIGGDDALEVANFYKNEFFKKKLKGSSKVDAQFMSLAFATFFTSSDLSGSNVASSYGFNVTETGIGTRIVNVGSNGAAFDAADGSDMTILALLQTTNSLTGLKASGYSNVYDTNGDGVIDAAEAALRAMANDVYSSINETGDI